MHTENFDSNELIRAAVVAQLAKPAVPVSQFWQITRLFKYQTLTWIGIVGSAITLFANLNGVLDLADWAGKIVIHWHEWNQAVWGWMFSLIEIKVPREFVPIISFTAFTAILVLGGNLSARKAREKVGTSNKATITVRRVGSFIVGVLLFPVTCLAVMLLMFGIFAFTMRGDVHDYDYIMPLVFGGWAWIFPIIYLLVVVKERLWVLASSVLFLVMFGCGLWLPLRHVISENNLSLAASALALFVLLQICWMAVILFSPLPQLTRRLSFVVLGVLTLVGLSEISKLSLHQYLQPSKGVGQFGAVEGYITGNGS
jgi:hypothetical protein